MFGARRTNLAAITNAVSVRVIAADNKQNSQKACSTKACRKNNQPVINTIGTTKIAKLVLACA